ncbi:GNAT family N-acetyltransferase [Francisella tularensis]|nr:GNAT family N-acetyltransferase [Francisella tularensis]ADA78083.1 Acetyltransferase [Francisella tularensis subsp. tularensis NE061598]AJI68335.1 acetyltransferase domain protein [Francisella tularensis subsp. tularensis SCHU S4]AJI72110.1 acetyltransferase domain protein [Francisella tularensis subsp. tularensis]APS91756.1 acetyltransferase [Francisella tularensis]EOA46740.1 N-acetyltransferase GCN5 [Francisella tularensis subsp. tularensis 1378]
MNFNKSLYYCDISLQIMTQNDFDRLYSVAKDPEIWTQHNDKSRSELDGFRKYFDGGLNNPQNCYLIFYKKDLVGSTRYYEYDSNAKSIKIGYTFYAKKYWGTDLNGKVKKLMVDYAFKFVDDVFFDVWDKNFRSQKAVAKLGAKFYCHNIAQQKFIFRLTNKDWQSSNSLIK